MKDGDTYSRSGACDAVNGMDFVHDIFPIALRFSG
jgi:hypothetical protein